MLNSNILNKETMKYSVINQVNMKYKLGLKLDM